MSTEIETNGSESLSQKNSESTIPDKVWRPVRDCWRKEIAVFREYKPLAIGIAEKMIEHGLLEAGDAVGAYALLRHVRSLPYLQALIKMGPRYNLDGSEANSVVKPSDKVIAIRMIHGDIPRYEVGNPKKPKGQPQVLDKKIEIISMHSNAIHAKLSINDFAKFVDWDTTGSRVVNVRVETPSGDIKMPLNSKSFRNAQTAFKEASGNAVVLVSGMLNIGSKTLEKAGISVQIKSNVPSK